jgi:hypothetical protein
MYEHRQAAEQARLEREAREGSGGTKRSTGHIVLTVAVLAVLVVGAILLIHH